jgi:putative tryptophan/tyrosine transport system substrate-binding protein
MSENHRNPEVARAYQGFFDELRGFGYVEKQNLIVERYSAEGQAERFRPLAEDVVRRNADVIYAIGPDVTLALKAATTTVPIVAITSDPIATGIVPSLARPGGNITGATVDAGFELPTKRMEVLRHTLPRLSRLACLVAPTELGQRVAGLVKDECNKLGITFVGQPLDGPIDEVAYQRAFEAMTRDGADAVIVDEEPELDNDVRIIVRLAEKHRLPAILRPTRRCRNRRTVGLCIRSRGHSATQCWRSSSDLQGYEAR